MIPSHSLEIGRESLTMTNMFLNPEVVSCPEKGHPAPRGRGHAQHSVFCHPNARRSDNSHASTRIPLAFLCSLLADQLETQSGRDGSTGTGAALSTIPREPTSPAPAPPALRLGVWLWLTLLPASLLPGKPSAHSAPRHGNPYSKKQTGHCWSCPVADKHIFLYHISEFETNCSTRSKAD